MAAKTEEAAKALRAVAEMVPGRTKRYRVTKVLRPEEWLKRRLEDGENRRFVEFVQVTPHLAEVMLEHNDGNRAMPSRHKLVRALLENEWLLSPAGLAFSHDGRLLDGQTRLTAFIEAGATVEMAITFGCEPEEFKVIDYGKNRSTANDLQILAFSNPLLEKYSILRAELALLYLRLNNVNGQITSSHTVFSREERMDAAIHMATVDPELLLEAMKVGTETSSAKPRVIDHRPATYAFWYLGRALPESSREILRDFFRQLRDGSSHPTIRGVRRYLGDKDNWQVNSGFQLNDNVIRKVGVIVQAFNAFVEGKKRAGGANGASFRWQETHRLPEVIVPAEQKVVKLARKRLAA